MNKKIMIILMSVIILFVTIFVVEGNIISPVGSYVTEETINRDVILILRKYRLEKGQDQMICNNGDSYYWTYYKNGAVGNGKALFMIANTMFGADLKRYIEIEAIMDIWIYIKDRSFPFEIDGITFYYEESYKFIKPSEVYMSKEDFMNMYNEVKDVPKKVQIEKLTKMYIEKSGYKRVPGNVQAEGQYILDNTS